MKISELKNVLSKRYNSQSIFNKLSHKFKRYQKELYMGNDLLFSLTYMASISTANLTRDKIFSSISEKKEYCPSIYFNKVRELAQHWHYDYANSCELISTKVTHERLRELFNRLSNAISAGEPDNEFLTKEWKLYKTKRKDEVERDLETTKEWANAYTALLVSTSLIAIIILLSVILYNLGDPARTLYFAIFIVFLMAFFGVGLLFRAAPKDARVHGLKIKSKEQVFIYKWMFPTLSLSAFIVILFTILPAFIIPVEYPIDIKGIGMVFAGISLLPVGIVANRDVHKVNKRDESYTTFISSLGSIVSGSGLTVPNALLKIDPKNLGELKDMSQELYKTLATGLDPRLCWGKFVGETGSYLIYKLTNVFVDAVNLGGNAETIGELVSSSNLEIVLLRMKRERISSAFTNLVIPLHISMVALLLFIGKILTIFTTIISSLFTRFDINGAELEGIPGGIGGMNLGIFGGVPVELLGQFVIIVILILTLANALAIIAVKGGPMYLAIFYGGIMFILSGVLMIGVPPLVDSVFSFDGLLDDIAGGL
ncbi:archaellar assembly protein FlaJ [Methanosarcina sp. KYL-1]|uniref:archaellar assembly protein FlaJ n=1 Tax=Methanosarcina sp. KYL-1 TaxID=2602068 RepID=UPI002101C817|nr:archaellar assembly protein FlaJ [Methanosarcina sp. KYL-1]MCQ1535935.1 archaellar assembly protein FlaJ [Methanosarcina sp. KYL-1]